MPIAPCQFAKPPIVAVTNTLTKVLNRQALEMLKMKEPPEMYMKTKDRQTQWPKMFRAFVPGLRHFRENGQQSIGLLGRKCTDYAITGAKPRPESAHRFIGPSIHRPSEE